MEEAPVSSLAGKYHSFLAKAFPGRKLHEDDLPAAEIKPPSELEWQCRWFAGDFGSSFLTTCGKRIEVIQTGYWNHGAGPDFRGAAIEVDGERKAGDIELDMDARDWEGHGHSLNPEYDNVILHLIFQTPVRETFTRTAAHGLVPRVLLETLSGSTASAELPEAKPGRCSPVIRSMTDSQLASLFESAARYRLERKGCRWSRTAAMHGWSEAAYQGMAESLGYSRNKLPMLALAQRLSLAFLAKNSAARESLLFGCASFLDGISFDDAAPDTRSYLRGLWEQWWKHRAEFGSADPRRALRWKAAGIRPMNHPQRRIAALSEISVHWKRILAAIHPAASFHEKSFRAAMEMEHPYWSHHYTLTSDPSAKPMALIGLTRTKDMLANVIYPLLIREREDLWTAYLQMKSPLENEKSRRAQCRIFGDDMARAAKFSSHIFHQQALIQLYEDFCTVDQSDCAQCPFPEQLGQWRDS